MIERRRHLVPKALRAVAVSIPLALGNIGGASAQRIDDMPPPSAEQIQRVKEFNARLLKKIKQHNPEHFRTLSETTYPLEIGEVAVPIAELKKISFMDSRIKTSLTESIQFYEEQGSAPSNSDKIISYTQATQELRHNLQMLESGQGSVRFKLSIQKTKINDIEMLRITGINYDFLGGQLLPHGFKDVPASAMLYKGFEYLQH